MADRTFHPSLHSLQSHQRLVAYYLDQCPWPTSSCQLDFKHIQRYSYRRPSSGFPGSLGLCLSPRRHLLRSYPAFLFDLCGYSIHTSIQQNSRLVWEVILPNLRNLWINLTVISQANIYIKFLTASGAITVAKTSH